MVKVVGVQTNGCTGLVKNAFKTATRGYEELRVLGERGVELLEKQQPLCKQLHALIEVYGYTDASKLEEFTTVASQLRVLQEEYTKNEISKRQISAQIKVDADVFKEIVNRHTPR